MDNTIMDNAIDRALGQLGIYNSVAVLMTGLIAETVFYAELYLCRDLRFTATMAQELIGAWDHTWFWITSVFTGYLLGMLLNSWGGFFHYILKKLCCRGIDGKEMLFYKNDTAVNNRIIKIKSNYKFKDDHNIILWNILIGKKHFLLRGCSITDSELDRLMAMNNPGMNQLQEKTITDLYQACKQKLSPKSELYALQQQSIAAMCRSLGFFFILLLVFFAFLVCNALLQSGVVLFRVWLLIGINLFVAITMWLKNERFVRLRYITILRAGMRE